MNTLHIYPTSRALRTVSSKHKEIDTLLPSLMRMDEFEQRSILLENRTQIDPMQRILFLREAASFEAFGELKFDLELVRFFTKSDAIFKFFEELSAEHISFDTLTQADAYAEFDLHISILERLFNNYRDLLDANGFTDKAFIPSSYKINMGFIQTYEQIEIHLEGYISLYELELLEKISELCELIVHYTTSRFNTKMQERFEGLGVKLPNRSHVVFSLSSKEIISQEINRSSIDAKVISVEERGEQVAIAFIEIEQMVSQGIDPENIVLVLPDEKFKEHFTLYDAHNNLNFAMGYDYSKGHIYKSLEALYRYWQSHDEESKYLVERYGISLEDVDKVSATKRCDIGQFFSTIDGLKLLDSPLVDGEEKEKYSERVQEKYQHFLKIFVSQELSIKEWLFLWLKTLSKITIDDVRGGLITVMGVLETRGVTFEGVVIVDFNEGIVPTTSSKDQFLNSQVRAYANLPTKNDREALQKQYYQRLLEGATSSSIIYSTSDSRLPSKFLYELGLDNAIATQAEFDILYNQPSQLITENDPIVDDFRAHDITWSASRLRVYLECKRKYYHRYIQKIKPKDDDELNEGAFLHSLLEHLHREEDSFDNREEMQKGIDRLLGILLPLDDAKISYQKLLWREKLKGFIRSQIEHFKSGWRVVSRELEAQGDIGGLQFKGRIDRIDQNATHTLVLDYKSGQTKDANKVKNLETLTDFQMSIYHQILQTKYQNINLAFLKIFENGELEEITALEEKNELLFEHIAELKQTRSFVAEKCEELQRCKWCEFTLMCGRGEYL